MKDGHSPCAEQPGNYFLILIYYMIVEPKGHHIHYVNAQSWTLCPNTYKLQAEY